MSAAGAGRVAEAEFAKSFFAQQARIAAAAGAIAGARIIARCCEAVLHAQLHAGADDGRFVHFHQWRVNAEASAFRADSRGAVGQFLECLNEGRAAVRIAAEIQRIDADEDVARADYFRPRESEREEDGVARGDVGDRDAVFHLIDGATFGNGEVGCKGGSTERAEINGGNSVLACAECARDAPGGGEFGGVALPIAKGKGVAIKSAFSRDGENGGRIESAAEKNDGFLWRIFCGGCSHSWLMKRWVCGMTRTLGMCARHCACQSSICSGRGALRASPNGVMG